jgi:cyclophilin family peptidyl-prolyl cis-trans isomerase/HEAT repeat protein
VLLAGDRRAATSGDLAVLRSGARSGDALTVRAAIRALGRLERPALIPEITPALRHALPEVRAEAACAIGQAAQGWKGERPASTVAFDAAVASLVARLGVEAEPGVRAAIGSSIGRMPYASAAQVGAAERVLVGLAARATSLTDRLGVAGGLEALVRLNRPLGGVGQDTVGVLRRLVPPAPGEAVTGVRVRRLALEALITATAIDDEVVRGAARDPDAQVRRLAMRAAATGPARVFDEEAIDAGMGDASAIVRLEALRAVRTRALAETANAGASDRLCTTSVAGVRDRDANVALTALDQLSACGSSPDAVAVLVRAVDDLSEAASPRGWHRAAHAIVALATASPDRAMAALPQFTRSRIWQLRMYAARAATAVQEHAALERLARDEDDNVRTAAVEGLRKIAGHEGDAIYVEGLTRRGNQLLRESAAALDGTPHPEQAVPALKAVWQRLVADGRDNSHDARAAIAKTLTGLGASVGPDRRAGRAPQVDLNAEDLRRLASPRARVTMRGLGVFELALITSEAPSTVLRFARLAESGYYNGLTFHRVAPNFVIQGGSPGANEFIGDAAFMRDEVGLWPHVRGAVGISTRGRDTGDAQIFIDLVDNPRLDHAYTVFAQVLNGMEVVDQVLEGDVIEKVEILSQ